ncbi:MULTISPECIES: RibD family protein [unclassified Cellvibrio]|uniref:RibD family protein n=1 Tax=unclassified Cellvibrio TaxID=2624793 RepID=UPI001247020C|nr:MULTISPECIES: RibD family protein [unclassified Cellvibrio]QEY13461.1 RibD family protein [Cellvibrio sp. KY-YJ-3]UUA73189.1 RibD family protein [Cellvibrio sp. QJXJ]
MNLNQRIENWLTQNKNAFRSSERPFVTLSYAQSLDGSIALRCDEPLALSGEESLRLTHQLRSMHDGILVGIGTVLSDDPQLTVRHWIGHNPQPIVLDSQLRIPAKARLCCLPDKRCWVLTTVDDEGTVIEGLEITALQGNADGRVCLQRALKLLWSRGIKSLMVEGGASVISAFLKARLVDALVLTITPQFVGGYKAVTGLGNQSRGTFPQLKPFFSERLGDDLIVWGNLNYSDHTA